MSRHSASALIFSYAGIARPVSHLCAVCTEIPATSGCWALKRRASATAPLAEVEFLFRLLCKRAANSFFCWMECIRVLLTGWSFRLDIETVPAVKVVYFYLTKVKSDCKRFAQNMNDDPSSRKTTGKLRSLFERFIQLIRSKPASRDEALEILKDAQARNLIDPDFLPMIEGFFQIASLWAGDGRGPRAKMEGVNIAAGREAVT